MFPYPSGDLHIGHWYNFAGGDILARKKIMEGFNILAPIGFDAFGLPAENAAIKSKLEPRDWTEKNISAMTEQIRSMGAAFDLSRVIDTSKPDYYRFTQWLFLKLFEAGLARRRETVANWCPSCQTVLANEQVIDDHCERCRSVVIQKSFPQWQLKITDYADRLLRDLEKLDWPEKTKAMQRNWIGRSEGTTVNFQIDSPAEKIEVFTTRPETLYGATYLVLAPEHPSVEKITRPKASKAVKEYQEAARHKTELERQVERDRTTGVFLENYAVHPLTGKRLPIWIADFVLLRYGAGAVMAVPAHDRRDWRFAKAHDLPIIKVINGGKKDEVFTGQGKLVNSEDLTGLSSLEAKKAMIEKLDAGGLGRRRVEYHLRDWTVSRQRYWGAPIPIIYCPNCGRKPAGRKIEEGLDYIKLDGKRQAIVPVKDKDLPVLLPEIKDYRPKGRSPLETADKSWLEPKCPRCGEKARRETETLDTFVDSSWYFLRFADPKNKNRPADRKKLDYWLPVDIYIGGNEHSVLHLLYARFITKFLFDQKIIGFDEPFPKLRHQGVILGSDRQKMSKSRGNVVDPDRHVKTLGADVVRGFLAFMGPFDRGGPWNDRGLSGIARFYRRVYNLPSLLKNRARKETRPILNQTILKVSSDIERLHFNTALSSLMSCLKKIESGGELERPELEDFLKVFSPFAPHLAEEIWSKIGNKDSIFGQKWPAVSLSRPIAQLITLPVQINGKLRGQITISGRAGEKEATTQAMREKNVRQALQGRSVAKIVYRPGRILNIVVLKA